MSLELLLTQITCIVFFLIAFISFSNPTKFNTRANRWFGVFFISVAFLLMNTLLSETNLNVQYEKLYGFAEITRFAMAPALYLAIIRLTVPGRKLNEKNYLHFIPFAAFFLYMMPMLIWTRYRVNLPHRAGLILATSFILTAKLQPLIYWVLSIRRLYQHQKKIQLIVSDTSPVNLRWLRHLLVTLGGMIIFFTIIKFSSIVISPIYTAVVFFICSLFTLYYLLAQRDVYAFGPEDLAEISIVIDEPVALVQQPKPRIDAEHLARFKVRLEELMIEDKLYLDSELSLPQLACAISISIHDLSWLLNNEYHVNFFQYINAYRILEAKRLLALGHHKHLNMLGIAYNSGFNSKSTFNATFKKETGLSPTQFLRQVSNSFSTHLS